MTDDAARGRAIEKRMKAMGHTHRSLEEAFKLEAKEAGGKPPSRPTITKAANGMATEDGFARVEAWLGRLEERTGYDDPDALDDQVEIRLSGNFGVDIVVKGSASNQAELEASAIRLLREARAKD